MFSSRFNWNFDENALARAIRERRSTGLPLLDLTNSNPSNAGFSWDANLLNSILASQKNGTYEPAPRGILTAREAVSFYYEERDANISPEQIHLTASTSEGYGWLLKLLTEPGDAILAPAPSYPLLQFLANLENVKLETYPLSLENDTWRVNATLLEKSISAGTKAIFCVSPNNPTGSILNDTDRKILVAAAEKHHLALIVDEVFLDFGKAGDPLKTWAGEAQVPFFVLSGLSKIAALPQMKLGWIATCGEKKWRDAAIARLDFIADTFLSVNAPVQNCAAEIFTAAVPLREKIRARLDENEIFLKKFCEKSAHDLRVLSRDGGWTAMIALPRGVDENALTRDLARRSGVISHPGFFYDTRDPSVPFLVLSLLTPPEIMRQAVPFLEDALLRF